MNIHKILLGAALTSLSMAAPTVAEEADEVAQVKQDPFDKSHQRCQAITTLKCAVLQPHVTKVYTIGEVVSSITKRPFSDILKLNGWENGEVTPETILPQGKKFAVRGNM
jgi:hypothetical protein